MNLRLRTQDRSLKIVGIHAKVISAHRQPTVVAQPSAVPTYAGMYSSVAISPSQSPGGGPASSESGPDNLQNAGSQLYKLPELKNLVGKRFRHAYLSGSFICLAVQGSHAGFHPYNDTPFVGPATTQQAEMEFQQGTLFLGSTEVLVAFTTPPQLHIGMAVHFSANSPLKINSVEKAQDGHYVVYAEYDH
jgi:hypothetical protein